MTGQIGAKIKSKRLAKKLTQAELAADICTQATISNLENKDRLPTISVLLKITNRLDIEFSEVYAYTSGKSANHTQIYQKIRDLCRIQKHQEAYDLITTTIQLDQLETNSDIKRYYYYLGITGIIGYGKISDGIYYFNQALSKKENEQIDYLDISALNGLAIAYDIKNEDDKALNYYQQSLTKLEALPLLIESIKDKIEIAKVYYNTAKFYSKIEDYSKAIELCTSGIKILRNQNLTYYLDYLLYEKGFNLMHIKKIDEAEKYYLYALILADIHKNQHILDVITNDVKLYRIKNVDVTRRLKLN
ncbi:helix-turn-helix domain-containing protein [Carnobacterium maltaromaticum]|uniref:helix-turn-helix domain-containing protein n=1 Tax=Carnobacterium maltaromaticum TaxID=2751 RepID=UPI00298BAFE4|nr:helix-turn-helix domain-containing protein [Carnobacterium maltaromaticum]MDW5525354.1 helix-turn-helix domain-containing protein [Carnobacterium maltaromaticum]